MHTRRFAPIIALLFACGGVAPNEAPDPTSPEPELGCEDDSSCSSPGYESAEPPLSHAARISRTWATLYCLDIYESSPPGDGCNPDYRTLLDLRIDANGSFTMRRSTANPFYSVWTRGRIVPIGPGRARVEQCGEPDREVPISIADSELTIGGWTFTVPLFAVDEPNARTPFCQ